MFDLRDHPEILDIKDDLNRLRRLCENLMAEKEEKDKIMKKMEKTISDMEDVLCDDREEKKALKDECFRLSCELSDLHHQLRKAEKCNNSFTCQIVHTEEENCKLNRCLQELQEKVDKLREDKKHLTLKYEQCVMKRQDSRLRDRNEALAKEKKRLENKCHCLNETIRKLEAHLDQMETSNACLQKELEYLRVDKNRVQYTLKTRSAMMKNKERLTVPPVQILNKKQMAVNEKQKEKIVYLEQKVARLHKQLEICKSHILSPISNRHGCQKRCCSVQRSKSYAPPRQQSKRHQNTRKCRSASCPAQHMTSQRCSHSRKAGSLSKKDRELHFKTPAVTVNMRCETPHPPQSRTSSRRSTTRQKKIRRHRDCCTVM